MRSRLSGRLIARERSHLSRCCATVEVQMPIWMEILVNVLGYGGFVAVASLHKSSDGSDPSVARGDRG